MIMLLFIYYKYFDFFLIFIFFVKFAVGSSTRKEKGLDQKRAAKIVSSSEFDGQLLDLISGKIYCKACSKFLSFKRVKHVRQHIFGTQNIKEAQEISELIGKGVVPKLPAHLQRCLAHRKRKEDQVRMVEVYERWCKNETLEGRIPQGQTLSEETLGYRGLVCQVLTSAGIPLNKLLYKPFLALLEDGHCNLGGSTGVCEMLPTVDTSTMEALKASFKKEGFEFSIIFDGSCINYPLEALVVRFIDDGNIIQQRVVGITIPKKPLTGATAGELLRVQLA